MKDRYLQPFIAYLFTQGILSREQLADFQYKVDQLPPQYLDSGMTSIDELIRAFEQLDAPDTENTQPAL